MNTLCTRVGGMCGVCVCMWITRVRVDNTCGNVGGGLIKIVCVENIDGHFGWSV